MNAIIRLKIDSYYHLTHMIDDLELFMAYEPKITPNGRTIDYLMCIKDHGLKVNLKVQPQRLNHERMLPP